MKDKEAFEFIEKYIKIGEIKKTCKLHGISLLHLEFPILLLLDSLLSAEFPDTSPHRGGLNLDQFIRDWAEAGDIDEK